MRSKSLELTAAIALAAIGAALLAAPAFVPPYRPGISSQETRTEPARDPAVEEARRTDATASGKVARAFIHGEPKNEPTAGPAAPVAQAPIQPVIADWIRPLGLVADSGGIVRLYLKDGRTGRLVRVRRDGGEEEGARLVEESAARYVISVDGSVFVIPRSKK